MRVPVVQRRDYTISLEVDGAKTFAHCDVVRWSAAAARALRADWNVLLALHGGPIYSVTVATEPRDYAKWCRFVTMFGFRFYATVVTDDGVRRSVYVTGK